MTVVRYYEETFREEPRETEPTESVVDFWFDRSLRYAIEPEVQDDRCRAIVAERVLARSLLGLGEIERPHLEHLNGVSPFGSGGPVLSELVSSDAFVAMALVPLTPTGGNGRPCLARLYCVSGLKDRYFPSEFNSDDLESGRGYSWFVAGLGKGVKGRPIEGRSWLLAAELLRRVVEHRDRRVAQNLMTRFIVTGDIAGDRIEKVEMGRKAELAGRRAFSGFKWIIPKENEMSEIPKRKIEQPSTLEEAYQLIESMRNTATKSFFRFIREGNLAGVQEQCRIGADLYASEESTGLTCLEVVADERARLVAPRKVPDSIFGAKEKQSSVDMVNLEGVKENIRKRVESLDRISLWLRQQGVDSAMMYYLMARTGNDEGIKAALEEFPINARDENGLTAVDWALSGGEYDAAKLLHRYGGTPATPIRANKKLDKAIGYLCDDFLTVSPEQENLIIAALDAGLSPEMTVENTTEAGSRFESFSSLMAAAIWHPRILEACLRNGADANNVLRWWRKGHTDPCDGEYLGDIDIKSGTPLEILSEHKDETKRKQFYEILVRYGAKITGDGI